MKCWKAEHPKLSLTIKLIRKSKVIQDWDLNAKLQIQCFKENKNKDQNSNYVSPTIFRKQKLKI